MILTSEALGKSPPRWWKLALFIPALVIFMFGFGVVSQILFMLFASGDSPFITEDFAAMEAPQVILLGLGSIAILHLFVWFWVGVVHGRGYWQFLNPSHLRLSEAFKQVGIYFGLTAIAAIISAIILPFHQDIQFVANWKLWSIWIVPIVLMILLQASAEEAVFRGYLQQYIAYYFPNFWVYGVIPSVIFGFLHYFNFPDDPFLAWAATISISVFGIIMADWARVTKSTLGPILYHSLNNILLIAFIGNSLEPSDMHLLRIDYSDTSELQLALVFVSEVVINAVIYLCFRKYYLAPQAEKKRLEQLHLEATKPISYVD